MKATKNVLWISRHRMTDEQLSDLKRIYGNVTINQISKTVKSTMELKPAIDNSDIIAIVLPLHLQSQILKIAGNKPVIMSESERIIIKDENGNEDKAEFKFKQWNRLLKVDIMLERL